MKRLIALVVIAAGIAAFVKRPVKQPTRTGHWGPAEHQPSTR